MFSRIEPWFSFLSLNALNWGMESSCWSMLVLAFCGNNIEVCYSSLEFQTVCFMSASGPCQSEWWASRNEIKIRPQTWFIHEDVILKLKINAIRALSFWQDVGSDDLCIAHCWPLLLETNKDIMLLVSKKLYLSLSCALNSSALGDSDFISV